MHGYEIGQEPPELQDDGSFMSQIGERVFAIVDSAGRCLSVDDDTDLLVEIPEG